MDIERIDSKKLVDELADETRQIVSMATSMKAFEEIYRKALAYQCGQQAIGRECSKVDAFVKVYADPSSKALRLRFNEERDARLFMDTIDRETTFAESVILQSEGQKLRGEAERRWPDMPRY